MPAPEKRPWTAGILAIALAALPDLSAAPAGDESTGDAPLRICHVANAGFMIESGGRKVLLDALVGGGLADYPAPGDAENERLETGQPPYDGVDIVFASHRHADHFNARAMRRHMRENPGTHYILTPGAFSMIEALGLPEGARGRITALWEARPVPLDIGGIALTLYSVDHSQDQTPQNLGLLLGLGGRTFFHPGDMFTSADRMAENGIAGLSMDYLLAPYWILGGDMAQVTQAAFDAGAVIPMHFPKQPDGFEISPEFDPVPLRERGGCLELR